MARCCRSPAASVTAAGFLRAGPSTQRATSSYVLVSQLLGSGGKRQYAFAGTNLGKMTSTTVRSAPLPIFGQPSEMGGMR